MQIKISHSSSCVHKKDFSFVKSIIDDNFVGEGNITRKLESALAHFSQKQFCTVVNNGSNALLAALLALGESNPDKRNVITSSYICPAVIHCIMRAGLNPILADINENDLNISTKDVLAKIDNNTLSVVIAHLGGIPVDICQLKESRIPIIEDCAQAIGSRLNERPVGYFGDLCIYSFGSTKMITGGIGGAILTNDEKWYYKIMELSSYDDSSSLYRRNVVSLPYNMKISDLNAGVIISQLSRIDDFIGKRREIAKQYDDFFSMSELYLVQKEDPSYFFNRYRYYVITENAKKILRYLKSQGIDARPSIAHNFAERLNIRTLKNLNNIMYNKVVSLPIYPSMTNKQVKYILDALGKVCAL